MSSIKYDFGSVGGGGGGSLRSLLFIFTEKSEFNSQITSYSGVLTCESNIRDHNNEIIIDKIFSFNLT